MPSQLIGACSSIFKILPVSIGVVLVAVPAFGQQTKEIEQAAAVKAAVVKIGTGPKARVRVTRRGKPKVKGVINEIRDDDFEVISDDKASMGVAFNIPYGEVVRIKGNGVDWRSGGLKASVFGLKALKVMMTLLKGTCLGPISRCSP